MENTIHLALGLALTVWLLGPLTLGAMSVRKAIAVDQLPRYLSAIAAVASISAALLFLLEIWGERFEIEMPSPRLYLYVMMGLLIVGSTSWTLSTLVTRYRPYPYDMIAISAFLLAFPLGGLTYWVANAIIG